MFLASNFFAGGRTPKHFGPALQNQTDYGAKFRRNRSMEIGDTLVK